MRQWQRMAAALTCTAVIASALGVPLPARGAKRTGERYPCENCACGCATAESCWRNCCCHSPREKLAWARRHGVTPPKFAIEAAEREARQSDGDEAAACRRPCCARRAAPRAIEVRPARPACCHAGERCRSAYCRAPDGAEPTSVLLVSALRCKGLSLSVALLPPSVLSALAAIVVIGSPCETALAEAPALYEPPVLAVSSPPPDALLS